LTSLVGGNIGANRLNRAYHVAWVGAGTAMLLTGSVGIFLFDLVYCGMLIYGLTNALLIRF
jgi:Na+-driven multidrug efflux pump